MSQLKIKDKKYYVDNKRFFNKHYNTIWKSISYANYVGSCSYLYQKYKPVSYQDFLNKYIDDYNNEDYNPTTYKGDPHSGRSLHQICALAAHYYYMCVMKGYVEGLTMDMCLDDIINHVIIETFDGHLVEKTIKEFVERREDLYVVEEVDKVDIKYGVDLTVRRKKDNSVSCYIQVKPVTTFLGNDNKSLLDDRKHFYNKEEEFHDELRRIGRESDIKPIRFICYNTNNLLYHGKVEFAVNQNNGGKIMFRLDELCDREGKAILLSKNPLVYKNISQLTVC